MDFHCLARKELQFLCKRNKIPANITNVAMAEALKALEIVEGLEELQSQSQSPEKTMNKEIPPTGTVTRTSTRRKPSKDEHQSIKSTIRTQKSTRKTIGTEEENKSLNVPEIEDQKKSDMVETPLPSGRRRPGVGSTRSKVEGTRRSVRLLEKCMTGLSIQESEKKAVKVDEMVECEVGSNNSQSGAISELPLARNLSASLEDEREFSDDVEVISKWNNGESNKKTDELEGEGSDGIGNAVSEDSINFSMELDVSKEGNFKEEPVVDVTKSIEELVANVEDVSEEDRDLSSTADMEAIDVNETNSAEVLVANVEDVPEEVVDHSSPAADMEAEHDDLTIIHKAEEHADSKVSQDVPVLPAEGPMDSSAKKGNEESNDNDAPTAAYNSESPRTMVDEDEDTEIEESDGDSDIDYDTGSDSKSLPEMTNMVDEEALVDANVTEVKTTPVSSFHNASRAVVDDIQVQQMENYDGGSEALINVCVMPAEEFAETSVKTTSPVSNTETITTSMPTSSPLRTQFSEQSKSSNKKQTTIPKLTQVSDNLNKEDIVEKELEPCLRKVKKNVLDEDMMQKLEGLSLRKLNQMFKELQINGKIKKKEDNKQPLGKSRPALQMLSQNSMKSEDEKQN